MKIRLIIFLINIIALNAQNFDEEEARDLIKCGTYNFARGHNLIVGDSLKYDSLSRPILQFSVPSKSGLFLLHYNNIGFHAVPQTDANKNSIPDYIDSAVVYIDEVFKVECNELGYKYLTSDSGYGGTNATDIYFVQIGDGELGNTSYGYTFPDIDILPQNQDNPRYTSHMYVDNDFSPKDSTLLTNGKKIATYYTSGLEGLKITLAHEFHHVIQNVYGNFNDNGLLHEMSSTYMESRVYPDVFDYMQYVKSLYKNFSKYVFGMGESNAGYRYSIYGKYLAERFDDNTLKKMWELSNTGKRGLIALDSALKLVNSSFTSSFCEFANWIYFSGSRSNLGKTFKNAELFPEIEFKVTDIDSKSENNLSHNLLAYEIRPIRLFTETMGFHFGDTLDLMLVNNNFLNALNADLKTDLIQITLKNENQNGWINFDNSNFFYQIFSESNYCLSTYFYGGILSECADFAFPNPFKLSDMEVYVPVECSIKPNTYVQVDLYDNEFKIVYSKYQKVTIKNGKRVAVINDFPDNISNGTYIYNTYQEDKKVIGKLAIIKE